LISPLLPAATHVAWRLSEYLPETLLSGLTRSLPYVLPCCSLRVPVTIFQGPTFSNDDSGTVLAAGSDPYIRYLPSLFLKQVVKRESVGVFPLWKLARVVEELRGSADLTVARLDRLSGRLLFGRNSLAVPDWINSWLEVPTDFTAWARASKLHAARLKDMSLHVSHERSDLVRFYYEMYVPLIRRRHGDLAYVRSFYQLRRFFDRGGILWLDYRGERIAGALFHRSGTVFRSVAHGTASGGWPPVIPGTKDVLNYFQAQHARSIGCARIDAGGSRPSLHDGVLRYKRKWGMNVAEKPDSHHDWFVQWHSENEKVTSFLSRSSLIFRDHGGLSAIAAIDREDPALEADARRAHHLLWMPGLQRLYLVAPAGWQRCAAPPPCTVLLDPKSTARLFHREFRS
jgi:hypothetical protein